MSVVIETTIGDVTVDLYTTERPRCSMNFLKLCKMKYYNLNLLFSVERNFIAQTGDPTGTGKGGESIYKTMYGDQARFFEGEKFPVIKHEKLGLISMVSCGSHLFGSQFFLTLGEHIDSLDGEHIVFGEVVEGMDVMLKLNQTLVDDNNRPYQDIRITHTVVLEDTFPDPEELKFPDESPRPTREILESDYIAADEDVDDTEGKTTEEIQEEIAAKEAKARATILEMVGDLKEADEAPPENVLFVCKLNPVTTSEDLEIIFSRFGKINSCEVIIDRITSNSLQYSFIEFAEQKSCEDAYFKMDNVLIDDRRIHVDFSQSVSKIKWRGKGKGVELFDDRGKKIEDKLNKSNNPERELNGRVREGDKGPSRSRGLDRDYNSRNSRQNDTGGGRQWEKDHKQVDYKDNHQNERGRRDYHTEKQRDRYDNRRYNREDRSREEYNRDDRDRQRDRSDLRKNNKDFSDNRHNDQIKNNERDIKKIEGNEKEKKHSHISSDDSAGRIPSDEEAREKMRKELKKSLKKKKKKSKKKSASESDGNSSDKESKKKKAKKSKKKKKKSSVGSESDSDSDSEPPKKKKKSKKKKKKKVHSESSSSD